MKDSEFPSPTDDAGSPTQDRGPRLPFDQSIRAKGFTIKNRPVDRLTGKLLEPIWVDADGKEHTHIAVLKLLKIGAKK